MAGIYWDERVETLPPETLARLQRHRLNWQLRRCWDASPFYRERFEAVGLGPEHFADPDILTRLPLLSVLDFVSERTAHPPFGRLAVAPEAWWVDAGDATLGPGRVWTDGDVSHRADIAARARTAAAGASARLQTVTIASLGTTQAYECLERNGLHWVEDHFLIEVLDLTTGSPVPDGKFGDLVLTDLTREGSPLIRLALGYTAALDRTPCSCGRTATRSSQIRSTV